MDLYIIPPVSALELMHKGDRIFCLTQIYLKNEEYREFMKARVAEGCWVTLDNGVGDHDPITQDVLFETMKDLNPSEVIPLDTLFDMNRTMKNLDDFIERMADEGMLDDSIQILGCPQGNTKEEWLECYQYMLENPDVSAIGLSKITVPHVFLGESGDQGIAKARNICFDYLKENDLLKKPLHLLGAGDPREFDHYNNHPMIRSNDTCNWVWSGINGISFEEGDFERIKTPKDYFDRIIPTNMYTYAEDNIKWVRKRLANLAAGQGLRYNDDKRKWSLVDFESLEPMVEVLEYGAAKYAPDNWKKGMPIKEVCESLLRHTFAFMKGEDEDPESGLTHIGHMQCNLMFLAYNLKHKPEFDDRTLLELECHDRGTKTTSRAS